MLTEKDFCDYDTSAALEELGYPRYHYDNGGELDKILRMVTLYNAQKWLREEMGVIVYPQYLTNGQNWMCMVYEEKKMSMHSVGRGSYNEVLNEGYQGGC